MSRYLIGAIAGLVATVAMTAAMSAMFRRLPAEQKYPLPPREITTEFARRAGVADALGERQRRYAALAAHFAFGAAGGALYAPVALRSGLPPAAGGIAWGLLVWAGSYLGWVPALRLLPPATAWPAGRNALMIAAHVVWGLVTGLVVDRLGRSSRSRGGFPRAGRRRSA